MKVATENEKKYFLKWVLMENEFGEENDEFLIFLIERPDLLKRIQFVREKKIINFIVIRSKEASGNRFEYKNDNKMGDLYMDLLSKPEETFYIELIYKNREKTSDYAEIVSMQESKPFIMQDQIDVMQLIKELEYNYKLKNIKEKIDKALDQRNEKEFTKLLNILRNMGR